MTTLLRHSGHEAVCAADGLDALNHVRNGNSPDLVLLDLAMPRMDGMEALAALRSIPRTRHTPIVVFSSQADSRTQAEAIRRGATAYWVKSQLTWDRLRNELDAYLANLS